MILLSQTKPTTTSSTNFMEAAKTKTSPEDQVQESPCIDLLTLATVQVQFRSAEPKLPGTGTPRSITMIACTSATWSTVKELRSHLMVKRLGITITRRVDAQTLEGTQKEGIEERDNLGWSDVGRMLSLLR